VQHLGMGGCLQKTKSGKRNERKHEERARSRTESPIVKPHKRDDRQSEDEGRNALGAIDIAHVRLEKKVNCYANQQYGQENVKDLVWQDSGKKRTCYRCQCSSERRTPLLPDIHMSLRRVSKHG